MNRNVKMAAIVLVIAIIGLIGFYFLTNKPNRNQAGNTPLPSNTATPSPSVSPSETASESPSEAPTATPSATPESPSPSPGLVIRTDYANFKPNEAGDIPIIMFHRFIEAYEPKTEKDYTTTFSEFETLLQTLYDQGYRLISMQDFIDCNVSVPAGTKPIVFTFDDGTAGEFNLIKENGELKVNPKSAVGIMIEFNKKHPDFGLKGIFYVFLDSGESIFKGEGSLKERFEYLENLGFEVGNHTWGHVDFGKMTRKEAIEETLGKNQEKAQEILPGLRLYSLSLPYGIRPKDKNLWSYLKDGTYNGIEYHNETIMAVGASPSVPSISKEYNSEYVRRIRAQGRVAVDADLTWWLPKMTDARMFISDGDPKTIVVPADKKEKVDEQKLNGKALVTY